MMIDGSIAADGKADMEFSGAYARVDLLRMGVLGISRLFNPEAKHACANQEQGKRLEWSGHK